MKRTPELERFRNAIFPDLGPDNCRVCRRRALGFRDENSAREFGISGMCQHCQDSVFADIEAIYEQYGVDFDDPGQAEAFTAEKHLLELVQDPLTTEEAQRWFVALLYTRAFKC